MKTLTLTKGKTAIVDGEWYPILSRWKWYYSTSGYAVREIGGRLNKERISMHNYIMMCPSAWEVDHINRNRLDNRMENLRLINPVDQQHNRSIQINNKTGYKGVCFDKSRNKYMASIALKGKQYNLGRYDTAEEAALAYNESALRLHGKEASLNEIKSIGYSKR